MYVEDLNAIPFSPISPVFCPPCHHHQKVSTYVCMMMMAGWVCVLLTVIMEVPLRCIPKTTTPSKVPSSAYLGRASSKLLSSTTTARFWSVCVSFKRIHRIPLLFSTQSYIHLCYLLPAWLSLTLIPPPPKADKEKMGLKKRYVNTAYNVAMKIKNVYQAPSGPPPLAFPLLWVCVCKEG